MSTTPSRATPAPATTRQLCAWALYDWATSPFFTVVITFVFATYFIKGVVGDEVRGTALWGWTITASALVIALTSPILGAVADIAGRRKPWLFGLTAISALATAALWWVTPEPSSIVLALALILVANVATEVAQSFYNAMLPDMAAPSHVGRWSGWGWGLGYASGIVSLLIVLLLFVQREPPAFGLDPTTAENIRICGPFLAVWLALFAIPILTMCPDRPATAPVGGAIRVGMGQLWRTLKEARHQPNLVRFLVARLIYNDGLNTLFAFGGIYAAGTFGMDLGEVIWFAVGLNVTAGLGAVAFAFMDDRVGSKPTILVSLVGLVAAGLVALLTTDKLVFWVTGLALGVFIGPAQSASRTFMARIAPADKRAELFGIYALTGKVTSFFGPFLFGTATAIFASQRAGMATVLMMFLIGGALLTTVKEPGRA